MILVSQDKGTNGGRRGRAEGDADAEQKKEEEPGPLNTGAVKSRIHVTFADS